MKGLSVRRLNRDAALHGQVLPIFALSLLMFIGIAALVIDLGFVWVAHRHQQDAVDPGALAAARYIEPTADTTKMQQAACFYARQNGYFDAATSNTGCIPTNDSQGTSLIVNYPPSIAAGQYAGHSGYVEVILTQPQRTFFAGIFGLSQLTITSEAVAAYDVGNSNSASLFALHPSNCPQGGGVIDGGAQVNIFPAPGVTGPGGYVQINSNCSDGTSDSICSTSGSQDGLTVGGSNASLTAPKIFIVGTCKQNNGTITGTVTEGANYVGDPLAGLRPPTFPAGGTACAPGNKLTTAAGAEGCKFTGGSTVTLDPGTYYGGWSIQGSNVKITLNPGIYVIAGGGISQTGGSLSSAGGRVLIYSTDDPAYAAACANGTVGGGQATKCQGAINLGGAISLNLTGLDRNTPCPPETAAGSAGCPFGGLLIWQEGHASNPTAPVTVEGSSSLYLTGTIYAPKANVKLTGSSVTTGCTASGGNYDCAAIQIISDTWNIHGGANLQMPYDPKNLYQLPLKGLVH
jgi:hypothetical protein